MRGFRPLLVLGVLAFTAFGHDAPVVAQLRDDRVAARFDVASVKLAVPLPITGVDHAVADLVAASRVPTLEDARARVEMSCVTLPSSSHTPIASSPIASAQRG